MRPVQTRFPEKVVRNLDKIAEEGLYNDRSEVIRDMVRKGLTENGFNVQELQGVKKAEELDREIVKLDNKIKRVENKLESLVEAFRNHTKASLPEWAKE